MRNVRYILISIVILVFSMLILCSCGGDSEDADCVKSNKGNSFNGPIASIKYDNNVFVNKEIQLDGSGSRPGPDGNALSYEWEIIEKPDGSKTELSNPIGVSPTFKPDKPGPYKIGLIVNDGIIKSEPEIIALTAKIAPPVAKPEILKESTVNGKMELDGRSSISGSGTSPLLYKWKIILKPDGSKAELNYYPDSSRPTFVPDKPGLYRVQLIVNDGLSESKPAFVDLNTKNSIPIASADYNRPIRVTDTVKLDSSASTDHDNDPLSYKWLIKLKPPKSDAELSSPNEPNPHFVADRPGMYVIQLIVNDGKKDSKPYNLTISTVNSAPVADAGEDQVVFEGDVVQLDGSGTTDVDGNPLTYKWSINERPPGSFTQISAPGKINPTFTPDLPGNYNIQLVVNDGKEDSVPSNVKIFAKPSIDLTPSMINLDSVVTDSQTLRISGQVQLEIHNYGTRNVEDEYEILIFEDLNYNTNYDSLDNVLGRHIIPKNAQKNYRGKNLLKGPQGNDSITVSVKIDGIVLFKGNLIYAFVDCQDKISEKNEDNNIGSNMEDKTCPPPIGGYNPVLEWEWTGSPNEPAYNQVICAPVVANLNDDNNDGKIDENDIPDIIFVTFVGNDYEKNGVLRAVSGSDGKTEHFAIARVDTHEYSYKPFPTYSPAVADVDNDGLIDIITIVRGKDDTKRVAVFNNDGTLKWLSIDASSSQLTYPASINIADLDNNGEPDLVIGNIVVTNTGSTWWIGNADDGLNNSTVADINLDRKLEIIAGRTVYDYTGKILWRKSELDDGFTGVANFDDDEFPEIVLVSKGNVTLLEHSGLIKWGPYEIQPGGPFRGHGGAPVITDADGDGMPEIGVAGSSRFSMYDSDGRILWSKKIYDPSAVTGSSAFDFEGDGRSEIIYRDHSHLRIFRGIDGVILFETPVESGTFIELPIVADVDNDNNAEIVVTSNSYMSGGKPGIQVYGDANDYWVNTRKIWNQHAYCITNVGDNGAIPQNPKNNWEVKGFNNFRQNQILNPIECSDLSASFIRINNLNCQESVDITVRIGNGGALHIPPGISVAFYRGNPDLGGSILGTLETNERIHPGKYKDIVFEMKNPGSGQHNIYVIVDEKGIIRETDEDNNTTMATFSCQ